jgi:hypothetical protein
VALTEREDAAEFDRLLTAWFYLYYIGPTKGGPASDQVRRATEHLSLTLLERHSVKIDDMRKGGSDDLKRVLDAIAEAINP